MKKKSKVFNLIQDINQRCIVETQVFQSVRDLFKRFLPRIRVGEVEYLDPQLLDVNELIIESNNIVRFDFQLIDQDIVIDINGNHEVS